MAFISKPLGRPQDNDLLLFQTRGIVVPFLCLFIIYSSWITPIHGAEYENVTKIFVDKLEGTSGYNTAVRPLRDQSLPVNVSGTFSIIAIVEINDISQQFIVNGFLTLSWTDELLAWDPAQYNYVYSISPYPRQIWRPRLVLGNTLENRDLFEDDYCPTTALYNGVVTWFPGSLFPTSCKLDLSKYPFDEQTCTIDLYSMDLTPAAVVFTPTATEVESTFFVKSGEWQLIGTNIIGGVSSNLSFFQVKFYLKRRPGFFIMNIVMPVVLLSFLNIMVFLIPVESGEKISYSITVLLALAVFMSIVSEMLPRSSDTLPLVTIYLLVLLLISVCTVIVAILIVSFHHRDEKETKRIKATSKFKGIFNKVKILNTATNPLKKVAPANTESTVETGEPAAPPPLGNNAMLNVMKNLNNLKKSVPSPHEQDKDRHDHNHVNKWRLIGRYIDIVSFVLFMTIWVVVTIGFMIEISS